MSAQQWNEVPARKGKNNKKAEMASETESFLSKFKTMKCENTDRHDWKLCDKFHDVLDTRRNPYDTFYSVEEAKNPTEKNVIFFRNA